MHRSEKKCLQTSDTKILREVSLGIHRSRLEGNILMDFKEIEWERVN
jgi:hypothetical protein